MSNTTTSQHTAFTKLPIVDISGLYSDCADDHQAVADELGRAARDAGFLYLKGHGVDSTLIDDLKLAVATYFASDESEKMTSYIGLSDNHTGYVPQGEEQFYNSAVDLKEAYDVGNNSPSLMANFTDTATNIWPKGNTPENDNFKTVVQHYYDTMLTLSRTLFRAFALALKLPENYFSEHLSNPSSQLRLIHYFDNPNAKESDSGIGAHTDYEFFTILLPTAPGLQVLNGAGDWINVPLVDGCFVINIGDMMEVITNGKYVATSHRVRQVKQERYSFPFFCSLDYDTVVEPIASLMTQNESPQYDAVICGDHLLAQTMQTFCYLKEREQAGKISLPKQARGLASFGNDALKDG